MTIAGALCAVINSCGGSNGPAGHVEISGKTPTEGADVAARAVCTREQRCGQASITCSGGAAGGSGSDAGTTFSCTATIRPVDFDECYEDVGGDIAELLACPALTPADVDMLELCIDALVAPKCETQAEADARARASEAGMAPTRPGMPPACAILAQPPPGC